MPLNYCDYFLKRNHLKKYIVWDHNTYKLMGAITFNGGDICDLRSATEH